MKADLFQSLLILFPEEPGLARHQEDGFSVKSQQNVATLSLSETFLVPAGILGCTQGIPIHQHDR